VFVFTTSDAREDVERSFQFNVCGYIVKPMRSSDLAAVVETLNAFWRLSEFPGGADTRL
jgi:AmiR/NasT family two-component response regulator